jgi:hypothetical protein
MFSQSLASLLNQLPARTVRLVAFNIDQQVVLFQKDDFVAADLPRLTAAFDQLELARVDVRTLQNRDKLDILSDLIDKELQQAKPASAVILMAPRSASHIDPALQVDPQRAAASRWFYLQYETFPPRLHSRDGGRGPIWDGTADSPNPPFRGPGGVSGPAQFPARSEAPDPTEQFFRRIKGEALPVRTPHDFAQAIHHMTAEIPTVKLPALPLRTAAPAASPGPTAPAESKPTAAQPADAHPDEAGSLENPVEVLIRLRDQVLEHANKVPNHTCVESVERQRFEPVAGRSHKSCDTLLASRAHTDSSLHLNGTDWLRLDVGLANSHEIFSWAGAPHFEERDLDEIVPEGAIGTGAFATMLISLFENRDTHFQFDGSQTLAGRRLMAYSFQVAQPQSHYRVKTRKKDWIVTGYAGELLVDPNTASLVRLTVRTDQLPESTDSCEIDTSLVYGMVPLGGFDYLLPQSTRQRFIGREGDEAENRTTFTACREYRGESTLTFGGRPDADAAAASPSLNTLPAGQPVVIELSNPISFRGAAAGDLIEGRLVAPIRDPQRQITLAPQGAKVQGRLMRVEMRSTEAGQFAIALRWETLELDGAKVPLSLKPNRLTPNMPRTSPGTLQRRGTEIELPRVGEELYGVYDLPDRNSSLAAGLRTEWVTKEP